MSLIERLEGRRMLSASLEDGTLTVDGTNGNDSMMVFIDSKKNSYLDVKLNGVVQKFKLADVEDIRMFGLNGNDVMKIDQRNGKVTVPVGMDGGDGNDSLTAASGKAVLHGGNGDDTLQGSTSNDDLEGGPGTDRITGGKGRDIFHKEHDTSSEILDYSAKYDRMV